MIVYNRETLQKQLNGRMSRARIYAGSAKENLVKPGAAVIKEVSVPVTGVWKNSKERDELLKKLRDVTRTLEARRVANAATGHDAATINALQAAAGMMVIDVKRQAEDLGDITPLLFEEKFDENATESVMLRDYLPYVGKEQDMDGASDTVPLIQHALPNKYMVQLYIRGFGDKTTLRELVFNPFHKTENIMESAARILADEKNADSLNALLGATYSAAHKQAADTTGPTYDVKMYNTLKKGIIKALNLLNEPLGRANGTIRHKVFLLVNDIDLINIQPIANGALANAGGLQQMAAALPLDGIIPYSGGVNDGLAYGNETLSYPGVPAGKCYVFVKIEAFGGYRIVKRNETMEAGDGDVLGLTTEKRAWHRIRGVFNDWVLPKASGGKNYGACVEVTLPEFN